VEAGRLGVMGFFLFSFSSFLSFLFSLFCKHLNSNFIYNFDFSTLSFFEFDLQIQFSKLVRGSLGQERMVSMIILGRYFFLIFSKISRANFSKKLYLLNTKKICRPAVRSQASLVMLNHSGIKDIAGPAQTTERQRAVRQSSE
jgi:hypothetical protein